MSTKKTSGFTLIELMVVIAIIGILTAIGAVNFANSREKARDAQRLSDIQEISLALEVYRQSSSNRKYPATLDVLATNKYLNKVPTDPQPPKAYIYSNNCGGSTVIVASLEDISKGSGALAGCGISGTGSDGRYTIKVGPATP